MFTLLGRSVYLFQSPKWIIHVLGVLIPLSAISLIFGGRIKAFQTSNRIEIPDDTLKFQPFMTTVSIVFLGALAKLKSVGACAFDAVLPRALYPLRIQAQKLIATDAVHRIPISLLGGLSYLAPDLWL